MNTPLLVLPWLTTAHAGELLSLQVKSTAPVEYQAPEPVTAEVNSAAAELVVPLPVREGLYVIPGVHYRLEAPRFIDPTEDTIPVPRLHEIATSLAAMKTLGPQWSVLGRVSAGLAGDLHALDANVVRIEGLVLGQRAVSDNLDLGLGAAATYAFGQLMPIPVVKLRWAPSEVFEITGLLPASLDVTWTPREALRLGVFGELVGNEYAVRLDEIHLAAPCAGEDADPSQCLDHIAYTDGNTGAFVGVNLRGGLWLTGRVGASIYRRFELLNADDEPVTGGEQRLSPAPSGELLLSWEY